MDPDTPTVSRRTLRFLDNTKVTVHGLDEIMADLNSEGRPANEETAKEIICRLEANKNYIPSSDLTRREYAYVLLKEYRKFVKDRSGSSR